MTDGKQGVLWIPVSEVNGYGIPPLLLNDHETRAGFPCSHCCASLTTGLGGENCQRDGISARGKWGKISLGSQMLQIHVTTMGDGVGSSHPGLCVHTVFCVRQLHPQGKSAPFFDMCLYAGDAFSFLKISFLARRRKGKTITKK